MMPVFTLVVAGIPYRYTAESAPAIGDVVKIDESDTQIRIVRNADGGRVFIGEVATNRD